MSQKVREQLPDGHGLQAFPGQVIAEPPFRNPGLKESVDAEPILAMAMELSGFCSGMLLLSIRV